MMDDMRLCISGLVRISRKMVIKTGVALCFFNENIDTLNVGCAFATYSLLGADERPWRDIAGRF